MVDDIIKKLGIHGALAHDEIIKTVVKNAYNLGVDSSAEKAEVLMTINDLPFVANNFSITTDSGDKTETFERKYTVYKQSILNLKIK